MWTPIRGYEGLYEINESGDVRRMKGFWCRTTRFIKPEMHKVNRSLRVKLCRDGCRVPRRYLVHRLVVEHFIGPIPIGLTVNHKDGDRTNNHVSNLEVATMREQMVHAYATGLQPRAKGEARKNVAKLTDAQVIDIRSRYKFRAVTGKSLAAEYGVSAACIWAVIRRDRWSHI